MSDDHWPVIATLMTEIGFARGTLEGLELQTDGHVQSVIREALKRLDELEAKRRALGIEGRE